MLYLLPKASQVPGKYLAPLITSAILLSISLKFVTLGVTADAALSQSAPLPLTGEAAVSHLKEQGLYSSLAEAVRAALRHTPPLPGRAGASGVADDRENAARPAVNAPLAQLVRLTEFDGAANDFFGNSVAVSGETVVVGAYGANVGGKGNQGAAYVFVRTGEAWTFQQKLTAEDGAAGDEFGRSVAVSGNTIVIAAYFDDIGANADQGAAYVFVRTGEVWSFQQKLTAQDGAAGDEFGFSVAVSGETVVVGAYSDDIGTSANQGSAYVFVRTGVVWSFQQKLTAEDGAAGDSFGSSVAISGNTAVVGANFNKAVANIDQGSAYVFVRTGAVWSFQQKLRAEDGAADDQFGSAVAISNDNIAVGAPRNDVNGNINQGAAYIFVRTSAIWSFRQKLQAQDGEAGDLFGISAAIYDNRALIGASLDNIRAVERQGSAYLFSRSGATWTQQQKLTADNGAGEDYFGYGVALNGDTAIAGALGADVGANADQGALYLFGCGHVERQTLNANDGATGDNFGHSVAVDGDMAVVGSPFNDQGMASDDGSAYVFVRRGTGWELTGRLHPDDGAAGDWFGFSVAISGDRIAVGAHPKKIGNNPAQGAAYVFVRDRGVWKQEARLLAGDGATGDSFGYSVSLSGDRAAVGAPFSDVGGKKDQGAVYLFTRSGSTWTPEIKLSSDDGAAMDYVGWSAALAGDRLIAGAPQADIGAKKEQGAAYVFENGAPWRQRAKLIAQDGTAFDQFGQAVALSGETALIGAPLKRFDTNMTAEGAAYVFVGLPGAAGNWSQQARLKLDDGATDDQLGFAVALSGDTAVVGAPNKKSSNRARQGAAFIFTRAGTSWSQRQSVLARDGKAEDRFGFAAAIVGDTILLGATLGGDSQQGSIYDLKNTCGAPLAPLASVSAASFASGGRLAPESISAGFGANLAAETQTAPSLPPPTTLGGVSVLVTDGVGGGRLAPIFFVSPGQINYQIPAGTVGGPATITVTRGGEMIAEGGAEIDTVAPGLFSADANGRGVAAAVVLRIKANGTQLYEPIARFDQGEKRYVAVPIDLGPETDQVFLVLFGTGIRYRSALSAVSCAIGKKSSEVLFAGAAPGYLGLDQLNVRLARALAGKGEIEVELAVDNRSANVMIVNIR